MLCAFFYFTGILFRHLDRASICFQVQSSATTGGDCLDAQGTYFFLSKMPFFNWRIVGDFSQRTLLRVFVQPCRGTLIWLMFVSVMCMRNPLPLLNPCTTKWGFEGAWETAPPQLSDMPGDGRWCKYQLAVTQRVAQLHIARWNSIYSVCP